jgi:prepilin-type N-terminal cleavage/methylation domain-containing protein
MRLELKTRGGFTLAEMLVALTIFGILFAATLGFLDQQTKVFNKGTVQMEALQNLRYGLGTLEKDLNTVGTNLTAEQPFMVYADTEVVVFNADYSSKTVDPNAVYVDTAMSAAMAGAVTRANQFVIPRSAAVWPDTNYVGSNAETILFFFTPDSTTTRTDDYLLMRQVNNTAPEIITRGVLKQPGRPFFEYFRRTMVAGNSTLQQVATNLLPMRHNVRIHGSPGDTMPVTLIDELRAVRVNFRTTDGMPGANERIFPGTRTIALPNAGQRLRRTCGDEPILGAIAFNAQQWPLLVGGQVRLTWNRGTDENSGEQDIIRYVIYRDTIAINSLTEPYLSVPATGAANYQYIDQAVTAGRPYYYGIKAQDCTPTLSSLTTQLLPVTP